MNASDIIAKIAKDKDAYYDALLKSQNGWHEEKDDPTAFIKYLLGTIISAYRDFEDRINILSESSLETVKNAVQSKIGKFTKRDITEICPSISASTVERHLKKLCAEGVITKLGGGRSTFYVRNQ